PLQDLSRLAQLLSGRRVDETGGLVPLEKAALKADWQALRPKYPADFAAPPAQVMAWHRREADLLESGGQRAAAVAHLDALIAARPARWSLRARRAEAYAERGAWERSRSDGAAAIALGADDAGIWYRQA